jgi:membrane protein YqaA with SNARE-associated domain
MNLRKFYKEIPKVPLGALIFYLATYLLWQINVIPAPSQVLVFLESLYSKYGLFGLSIATFLEGTVYLGLYFPGSVIIALSVFLSNGSFISLLTISIVVAITLTIASIVNYWLGRYIVSKEEAKKESLLKKSRKASKGLFVSMLHPNLLAFYFFNAGLEKQRFGKIIYVPIIMIPYGFLLAYLLYPLAKPFMENIDSPYLIGSLISIWLIVAFISEHKRKRRKHKEYNLP